MASAVNFSSIQQIDSLSSIQAVVEEDTLVLLDIDQTLIDSKYQLGSPSWNNFLKESLTCINPKTKNLYALLTFFIANKGAVEAIDKSTAEVISALQDRKIVVLGFTNRGRSDWYKMEFKGVDTLTKVQLNSVGIFLDKTKHSLTDLDSHFEGVLFVGNALTKAEYLTQIFKKSAYRPKKIVFVDDKKDMTESVEKAAKTLNVPYAGYHFVAKSKKEFNPKVATIQLINLIAKGVFLTDEQALESNVDGSKEALLELLKNLDGDVLKVK